LHFEKRFPFNSVPLTAYQLAAASTPIVARLRLNWWFYLMSTLQMQKCLYVSVADYLRSLERSFFVNLDRLLAISRPFRKSLLPVPLDRFIQFQWMQERLRRLSARARRDARADDVLV
jgi:hypothetical protein